MSDLMQRKNYCALPFSHTAIEANGDVKACCLTPPFVTAKGQPFNLNFHSLEDVYASEDYQKFLAAFKNDQRHNYCEQCWFDDDSGTLSNRKKFTNWLQKNIDYSPQTNARDLVFLEIKVGNRCNLMCRICGPHNSSKAANELFQQTGNEEVLLPNIYSDWATMDRAWDSLAQHNLKAIHIMGGEPFIDKTHLRLLNRLIDDGRSSDIILWYNTNGTTDPSDYLETWSRYKSVRISISLDDYGKRFEYQRYPAKWPKVEENIMRLYALEKTHGHEINIDICWSLFNIYYAEEIVDFYERLFASRGRPLQEELSRGLHFYTGSHYCPKSLRPEERQFLSNKLEASKYWKSDKYGPLFDRLYSHVSYDNFNESAELERNMKIKWQDKVRKQSFQESFPEISFFYKDPLRPVVRATP